MHIHETHVLKALRERNELGFDQLTAKLGSVMNNEQIVWALENLEKSGAVSVTKSAEQSAEFTKEGEAYLEEFPEEALLKKIKSGKNKVADADKIGLRWAKENGWITIDKGTLVLTKAGSAATGSDYQQRTVLNRLATPSTASKELERDKELVKTLVNRNLIRIKERSRIGMVKITEAGLKLKLGEAESDGEIGQLTREIIASGEWKGKKFRKYDVSASTEEIYPARLHPMHDFVDRIRNVWFNMGFAEVSGPIIESAFWNFDALFSPQDHPTREMQDTFFLSNPKEIDIDDIELLARVKSAHTKGWGDEWREELAKQALLRTHTTSVSAHYIQKFANAVEGSYPVKLFSVGKVFRNESIDYKHLAEFYQTDGIVIGSNLTLANLIDVFTKFFAQLGFEGVKFKPAYFPFVEPGLEAYYYNKEHAQNIELLGGGIIRKEITKAMGTNKSVLAWGMGIDRLIMNFMKLEGIPELYRNEVGWLRSRQELKG